MQVRPRSGLALRHGITLPNTPGTIDSDYRGPLGVMLDEPRDRGLTRSPTATASRRWSWRRWCRPGSIVDDLGETARGAGGFGSTGRG